MTGVLAGTRQRFAVKLNIDERDREEFQAAVVAGDATIYTNHLAMLHIIRKVILRLGSNLNYIIPKVH